MLTVVEAAIKLGVGVELIVYFTENCPKHNEVKTLPVKQVDGELFIVESALYEYQRYLNQPWLKPPEGHRPGIPKAIKEDIRRESHSGCAICGLMDNGEIAHIEAVAGTMNNSPDNLILLCPNHHSKYDYGHKLASNVTVEVIRAAKLMKRTSRQRMLRCEANATKSLQGLIQLIKSIEAKVKKEDNADMARVMTTEAGKLLEQVKNFSDEAQQKAMVDQAANPIEEAVAKHAPTFARLAQEITSAKSGRDVRTIMKSVTEKSYELLLEFDEVDCPHCGGRGMTGLIGDLCAFCKGSCVVTEQEKKDYDLKEIDEVECPHCHGRGTTGLTQNYCKFCRGSCVVSEEEAVSYSADDMDEKECPHCNGSGAYGRNQEFCAYCRGDCVVTQEEFGQYDAMEIDEVECPHCNGNGYIGWNQTDCSYCRGDTFVTRAEAQSYDREAIDEVECPNCNGRGTVGRNNMTCEYCGGENIVSKEEAKNYNPEALEGVECPKCNGRGAIGLNDDDCKFCHGNCVVERGLRRAFIAKYGDMS